MRVRIIILFFGLMFATTLTNAQHQQRSGPNPAIRKAKIELVTGRMNLSKEQSEKFLPVFDKYCDEKFKIRRQQRKLEKESLNAKENIELRQKLEEDLVRVKGNYKKEFLKIVNHEQLKSMYAAEEEFKNILLKELSQKEKK